MSFLFFIIILAIIFGLIILMGVFNIIVSILKGVFSFGKDKSTSTEPTQQQEQYSEDKKRARKLFNKEEAEDVEFEEIK